MSRLLGSPMTATGVAVEVARAVEKEAMALATRGQTPTLLSEVHDPGADPAVRLAVLDSGFGERVRAVMRELQGGAVLAPRLRFAYSPAGPRGVVVCAASMVAPEGTLSWARSATPSVTSGAVRFGGDRESVLVGRGAFRDKTPGATNDLALPEDVQWVSRDLFELEFEDAWRLRCHAWSRGYLGLMRQGRQLPLQQLTVNLADGDEIIVWAPDRRAAIRLKFQLSRRGRAT